MQPISTFIAGTLVVLALITAVPSAMPNADASVPAGCRGKTCEGMNPRKQGCTKDVTRVVKVAGTLFTAEHLYSKRCRAAWVELSFPGQERVLDGARIWQLRRDFHGEEGDPALNGKPAYDWVQHHSQRARWINGADPVEQTGGPSNQYDSVHVWSPMVSAEGDDRTSQLCVHEAAGWNCTTPKHG